MKRGRARRTLPFGISLLCSWLWVTGAAGVVELREGTNPPALHFSHLTVDDGLSANSGFAVLRDADGFLWLGTESGLNRFDGREFLRFDQEAKKASYLSKNIIKVIQLSPSGELWLARDDRDICRLPRETMLLVCYRYRSEDSASLRSDLVTSMVFDPEGKLWVGTRTKGLFVFYPEERRFEKISPPREGRCQLPGNYVPSLLAGSQGEIWVGTLHGLFRYSPADGGCFEAVDTLEGLGGKGQPLKVSALFLDRQGTLWVGTRDRGVFLLEAGTQSLQPLPLESPGSTLKRAWVLAFAEDSDGHFWLATRGTGLFHIDREQGLLYSYRASSVHRGALGSDSLRTLFVDRDDTLWIGTEQAGFSYLPHVRLSFPHHRSLRIGNRTRPVVGVFSLHLDEQGSIWAGTQDQGLYRLDPRSGQARDYLAPEPAIEPSTSKRAAADRVYALASGRSGEVLAGTSGGRLLSFRPPSFEPQEVTRLEGPGGPLSIRALVGHQNGSLWAATWQGSLFYLLPDRGDPVPLALAPSGSPTDNEDPLISLARDHLGNLWVGTWSRGLIRLDYSTGRSQQIPLRKPEAGSMARIAGILETQKGTLWIATDQGLFQSRGDHSHFEPFPPLGNEVVYGIQEDLEGNIWASGEKGLVRIRLKSGQVTRFHHRHGLQSDEFNVGAATRGPGGLLAFGGPYGFNLFQPESLELPTEAPPVVLTGLRTPGRRMERSEAVLLAGKSLTLAPEERSVAFQAAVLDYLDPSRNLYRHRLRGLDDTWSEPTTNPEGNYNNLPAGTFQLEIAGANSDGQWNPLGVAVSLEVLPRFWERQSVRFALALLGLGSMLMVATLRYRRRLRRTMAAHQEDLEVRQRLLGEREKERIQLALELHDGPLQELHALQLGLSRPRGMAREDLRTALVGLVAQLRSVCGSLRSPLLQPYGLAPALEDHAKRIRNQNPNLVIDLDLEPDDQLLPEATRLVLYRIFQESLTNALKHGDPSRISVRFRLGPPTELRIEDDGPGFQPPKRWIELARKGHLGILGMKERAESVEGNLEISSCPEKGTVLRVTIPGTSPGKEKEH
ncbi:MAG: hypothetical protein K0U98_18070 [Deltaproteobacteria bacterium]|nr:hypothetical protein [Deltaproteobacteria bacterium]